MDQPPEELHESRIEVSAPADEILAVHDALDALAVEDATAAEVDGRDLPGQTNRTLALNAVQPVDEGDYTVMVTNVAGAAVSEATRLYVVPASTNFILKNFTNAAGARLPYYFFLPSNYDPTRSYPLICNFPGSPSDETTRRSTPYAPTLVFGSYKQQATDPAILVWPTRLVGDNQWTDQYLQQVSGLLDWLPSNFNIDTNRVYISGFSEGVHAAWDLMGLRPEFFAAARLEAGWPGSRSAASIKDVPLWAFHAPSWRKPYLYRIQVRWACGRDTTGPVHPRPS
jgi:predicted peptidase